MYKEFSANDKVYLVRHGYDFGDSRVSEEVVKGRITLKGSNKLKVCVEGFDLIFKGGSYNAQNFLGIVYSLYKTEQDAINGLPQIAEKTKHREELIASIKEMFDFCSDTQLEDIYIYLKKVKDGD